MDDLEYADYSAWLAGLKVGDTVHVIYGFTGRIEPGEFRITRSTSTTVTTNRRRYERSDGISIQGFGARLVRPGSPEAERFAHLEEVLRLQAFIREGVANVTDLATLHEIAAHLP